MEIEKINFGYFLKNITIPLKKQYLNCFIDKLNNFIKRVCGKAFFYEMTMKIPVTLIKVDIFGFASDRFLPRNEALRPLKMDLYELTSSITLKPVANSLKKT